MVSDGKTGMVKSWCLGGTFFRSYGVTLLKKMDHGKPTSRSRAAQLLVQAVKSASAVSAKFAPHRVVAVSGGLDSMTLVRAMMEAGLSFSAAHFNHRWRGQESMDDARWLTRWARRHRIYLQVGEASQAGCASEGSARADRMKFLTRCLQATRASDSNPASQNPGEIWLAHHANDQAETFLLQLLRGAGPAGLASMRPRTTWGACVLVRPFLDLSRSTLEAAAVHWRLRWREDRTNQSLDYLRNRIRHQLLPLLAEMTGRDPVPILTRTAQILRDEEAYWHSHLPQVWPQRASVAALKALSVPAQRRWLRGWLLSHSISDVDWNLIERVRGLIEKVSPARVNLPGGGWCRRRAGELFLHPLQIEGTGIAQTSSAL